MDFTDGLVSGFAPRFRSFDDDRKRCVVAVVDLEGSGKITRQPNAPLSVGHCGRGHGLPIDPGFSDNFRTATGSA
ncbi:hypothetical protein [Defluviimonas sp. SAOS-178_SWC]|uniref:hypothetical protein n=1 Tax=Defluviimonas sp. SAOS-178_SWC TaxID=3121287 RepID=UPI0032220239